MFAHLECVLRMPDVKFDRVKDCIVRVGPSGGEALRSALQGKKARSVRCDVLSNKLTEGRAAVSESAP